MADETDSHGKPAQADAEPPLRRRPRLPQQSRRSQRTTASLHRIEFWGGEPFVYWKTLKPLAEGVRTLYPKARFNIITNGSLFDQEKIDWLYNLGFGVGISHDGPAYEAGRGADPLLEPEQRRWIRYAYTPHYSRSLT
jgi:hypothetical protein